MSMFKKILPALILGAICLICVLLLATTNELTKDAILEQEVAAALQRKQELFYLRETIPVFAALQRKQELFPEGKTFIEIEISDEMSNALSTKDFTTDEIHEAYDVTGNLLGYVVITRSFGYAGDVVVTSGFAPDGSVVRVFATAENDTPKLGKEVEKEAFLSQFKYIDAGDHVIVSGATGSDFLAVSGATITSKAAGDAYNAAVDAIIYLREEGVIGS